MRRPVTVAAAVIVGVSLRDDHLTVTPRDRG